MLLRAWITGICATLLFMTAVEASEPATDKAKLERLFQKRIYEFDKDSNRKSCMTPSPVQTATLIGAKSIVLALHPGELEWEPKIREQLRGTGLPLYLPDEYSSAKADDSIQVRLSIAPELLTARKMQKFGTAKMATDSVERLAQSGYDVELQIYQWCSVNRIPGSKVLAMTYKISAWHATLSNLDEKVDSLMSAFVSDLVRVTRPEEAI